MDHKLAVFYHVYLKDEKYKLWVDEQLSVITTSRLKDDADINVIAVHDTAGIIILNEFKQYMSDVYPWVALELIKDDPKRRRKEGVSLNVLYNFAKENPGKQILYMHTKGITRPFTDEKHFPSNTGRACTYNWRNCMQYYCIKQYKECINQLSTHDIVGVRWKKSPVPHFSGNFWWANTDYVATLESPLTQSRYWRWGRFSCEYWIGGNTVPHTTGRPRSVVPLKGSPKVKNYPVLRHNWIIR